MAPRPSLLAAVLVAVAAAGARADLPPPPPPVESVPAFFQLEVNGVRGEPVRVLLEAGDVRVRADDLALVGLEVPAALRDRGGRTLVSLRALAPAVGFAVDEDALVVRITAGPELLGRTRLDLRASRRPAELETAAVPAAFLNASVLGTTAREVSGFAEAGVSGANHLLLSSASIRPDGRVVRGLSALTWDRPERLLRATLGDAVLARQPLGGAPVVVGVGFARDLDLDPYLVRAPLPAASGFARTPSTLEVWVNGALVRTLPVAPGTYDLANLPVHSGANDVRVIVRDAFGREEALSRAYYQAQGLLAAGEREWGWNLGAVRERFGTRSFDLGDPVLAGQHRLGLTDRVTAGLRLEATPRLVSGGLAGVLGLPVGELQLAAAASGEAWERELPEPRTTWEPGGAALAAFRATHRRGAVGADWSWRSRRYGTTTPAGPGTPLWTVGVDGSATAGPWSAQLRASRSGLAAGGRELRLEANVFLRLGARAFLQVGGVVANRGGAGTDGTALLSLLVAAAPSATVSASAQSDGDVVRSSVGAQRPLPHGPGVGGRLQADAVDRDASWSGTAQAQSSFGRLEGTWEHAAGTGTGSLAASAGLVLLDGKLFPTRPVEASWAVVRVPGLGGVRAYLNNQEVGRTDTAGDLLVPGLLPFYGNRLSISDADVPVRWAVGRTARLVAPPRRGASLVRFDVAPLRAVTGRIVVAGDGVPPAFGTLRVGAGGEAVTSPVGSDGTFWLDGLRPGAHPAQVAWQGKACRFSLSVPEDASGIVEVGDLGCALGAADP